MDSAVLPTYGRADVAFEKGEGAYLTDTKGRRYLDFASGIAVTMLGHRHPHLVKALTEQANRVWHTSNLFRIDGQERLARRLVENSFADLVFFANSGAEAVECGLKIIRRYHDENGHPERYRVITFEGSFHGRTLATLAAANNAKYLAGFAPVVDGFDNLPFGDHEALKKAIGPETAAILIEPVQGEGGIRTVPAECLRGLREICDEHGLLLMFDEVQSGMGRTGKLFAHEWAGVAPDIMALAKALGGGFPVGACLTTEKVGKCMSAGTHGSTYGGNPLAMAVGNAVLDVMLEPGFLDRVQQVSSHLRQQLARIAEKHPGVIKDVRGVGLMLGLECVKPNTALQAALLKEGVLTVTAGDNVLRLAPPLIIGEAEIGEAAGKLDRACAELSA
ncbi:MAG: aspartate aminotransferase family protein [Alphaproteobacteria bacterium]|nr:aspartate aminotransferase family protein [Alphaproteobacteria bacterium]